MEVLKEKAAMLSNYEVFSLLNDLQKGQNKQQKLPSNLATISYEIVHHLENSPCASQNEETIVKFLKAVEPYSLTRPEKLQLLNLQPQTAVEIQLIVEESEERLTEDQIYELLDVIKDNLPHKQQQGEEEEEVMEEAQEEGS